MNGYRNQNSGLTFLGLLVIALLTLCVTSCQTSSPQKDVAELRTDAAGRTQVLIGGKEWRGVFTTEGYGGWHHYILYWATVSGPGPEYRDPVLHGNAPAPDVSYVGIITIDRKKGVVVIFLQYVSGDGQAKPCPANGTYAIESINKDQFLTPE